MMIEVENLTKWYGPVLAVNDISFEVDQGEVVGFLGPNGAGKSTTLKMLSCYLPATSGRAAVAGHDVLSDSLDVRRNVGYMPEAVPLYPELRVREYLDFRARLREIPRGERPEAIDRICKRCWLSEPEDMTRRRIGELSRGYKQRAGLAEILLHNPPVLILDEPTLGLGPAQIRSMRELIRELGKEHTVILSSHILAEVEQTCDRLIIIAGGRLAAAGTPAELRKQVSGPSRIVAELRGADEKALAEAAGKLAGARQVDSERVGNWTRLHIAAGGETDLRSDVYQLAADNGWTVRELRRESGSLEDFFVQITYQQNVQATGRRLQASQA